MQGGSDADVDVFGSDPTFQIVQIPFFKSSGSGSCPKINVVPTFPNKNVSRQKWPLQHIHELKVNIRFMFSDIFEMLVSLKTKLKICKCF
jgi:hypothetical protein